MKLASLSIVALISLPIVAGLAVAAPGTEPAAPAVSAGALEFDFADMKGVNGVSFTVDSTLEPITGFGAGIGGKVRINPADPKSLSGTLTLATAKLATTNPDMTKVMHGPDWLNAEGNPSIVFEIKSVKEAKPGAKPGSWDLSVEGGLSLNGVTKTIVVPVNATVLPGRLGDRMRSAKGDLLVLRSGFVVHRSEFNIKAGQIQEVVGEQVEVRAAIVGARKAE